MAKANFIKAAKADIYRIGELVTKTHGKGKNAGQEYQGRDRSKPATDQKDEIIVKKGESYYWWQFRFGGKQISKEAPKPAQLTQNAFKQQIYELQERLENLTADDLESLESERDEICSEIEQLADECDEKMNNMPEGLQGNSSSYEILEQRKESLEEWKSELENVDISSVKDEIEDEESELTDEEKDEKKQEILDELQGCTYNGD